MAITSISDLWVPDIWMGAISEAMANEPALINSGVVVDDDTFNAVATGGGIKANIPVWLDPSDQVDEIQVEDTDPTLQKLTSDDQVAPILNRVSANSGTALAAGVSGSDPVGFLTSKLAVRRLKQRQTVLVNILNGLFNTGGPLEALSDDEFSEEIASIDTATDLITTERIINATSALGERETDLENGAMFVHPAILAALRLQDENDFERDSSGPFTLTRWKGIPIFVSNALYRAGTTDGVVYQTYLIAPGTIAKGEKPQQGDTIDVASLQYDESKGKNNWSIYDRTRFLLHPAGMKFTGTPAGQSATNAELATPGNWSSVFSSTDRHGMVRIQSNG